MSVVVLTRASLAPPGPFEVVLEAGRGRRVLVPSAFRETGPGQYDAGPFATDMRGTMDVSCSVPSATAERVSVAVELPLREDWRYGVTCATGGLNPARLCFGCAGSRATPLGPAPGYAAGDSLFVVWGGTSISSPVVY